MQGNNQKEVQISTHKKNLNLIVLELLKKGKKPSEIVKELNITKTALQYYLSQLKGINAIKKIGYGTWEVQNIDPQQVQKLSRVANYSIQDSVRGHGFQFKYEFTEIIKNWNCREQILIQLKIPYETLKIFGSGQKIVFKGRKVWLTEKSIIIYEREDFMAELASEAKSQALNHFMKLLYGLENYLHANLELKKVKCKVTRAHYSLIQNALAKQYNEKGQKLNVTTGQGEWLLIDNSFNLNELETIHPRTAVEDNKKVQDVFNFVKEMPEDFMRHLVHSTINQNSNIDNMIKNQLLYSENMVSHVKAVQDLGNGVNYLVDTIKELKQEIINLKEAKDVSSSNKKEQEN